MGRRVEGPWYRASKERWYATVGGRKVSLGVSGRGNRAEATRAWHKMMAGQPLPTAQGAGACLVSVLVEAYLLDSKPRVAANTQRVYECLLAGFVAKFGPLRVADLKRAEVEAHARKDGWSATTRSQFSILVSAVCRWGVREGLLLANPLANLRKPAATSRSNKVVVTADEYARLLKSASRAFADFMRGLWLTGCRPGELARVTARDVNLAAGVAVVHEHKTADKTGTPRHIFLNEEAVGLFRERMARHPDGPLFRNARGNPWKPDTLRFAMEYAREKAGVPHAICYSFRHTFATRALAAGVPDATVAALLGHKGTAILHKHYSHLTSQAAVLRAAVNQVV